MKLSCTFVLNVRTKHGCPGKDGVHMCSCNVRSCIDLRFDEHEQETDEICKRKESTKLGRKEEKTVDGGVGAHVLKEGGCALSVSRISSTVLSPTGHPTQPRLGCASNWFELCLFGVKKASLPDVDSYYESGSVLWTSLDQT